MAIDLVETIEVVVNGYVLARSNLDDLRFDPAESDDSWLRRCFDERSREGILEGVDGLTSGTVLPPFVFTDFAAYLPSRTDD